MITAINAMNTATQTLQGLSGAGAGNRATSASGSSAQPTPFSELLTDAVGQAGPALSSLFPKPMAHGTPVGSENSVGRRER